MTRSTDKIIDIRDFNFQSVLDELNIRRKRHDIIRPLRYLFDRMMDELRPTTHNRKTLLHASAQLTIEKSSFILDLIDTYADDFLGRDGIKRDALYAACLMGDNVDPKTINLHIRGFSQQQIADIQFLNEESTALRNGEDRDYHRHSQFHAHLVCLQYLNDVLENISAWDYEQTRDMLDTELNDIEKIIDKNTDIGQAIIDLLTDVEQSALDHMAELDAEYEAEHNPIAHPTSAEVIQLVIPPKDEKAYFAEHCDMHIATDFNETAIYDLLSINDDKQAIRAAVRHIYSGLKEEFGMRTLDDRARAIDAVVDMTKAPYYMAREMAAKFIGNDYNHDAVEIAVICEQQSYFLGQHNIIDRKTATLAEFFASEAVEKGLSGNYDQIESVEAQFVAHVLAVKQLNEGLRQMENFESEEDMISFLGDVATMREFICTDKEVGHHFMSVLDRVRQVVAPKHFPSGHCLNQARDFLERKKPRDEDVIRHIADRAFYANDLK